MNDRVKELVEVLTDAARKYYTTGDTPLADIEYDSLEEELRSLDPENHFFSMVGTDFIPDKEKQDLTYKMYSTDKSLTPEELQPYWNRTAGAKLYVRSQKVDGLAVDLTYKKGVLLSATTRGNGLVGSIFTSKIGFISCIPNYLSAQFSGKVRGEIFLSYKAFEKLNKILKEGEEEPQENCRNSAAGLINGDISNIKNKERKLDLLSFRAYGVYDEEDPTTDIYGSYSTYTEQLEKARSLGFTPVEYSTFSDPQDFISDIPNLETWLHSFDFPNDGIVIRINDQEDLRSRGAAAKYLNGVTAFKFEPEVALVKVLNIEWEQGSVDITPVIIVEPTYLDGAEIKRVSGHSVKNLIDIEAYPGSSITILRSGSVIPVGRHRNLFFETSKN